MKSLDTFCDPELYGGKASGLSTLIRANDPLVKVPMGYALEWCEEVFHVRADPAHLWAVRSSAIGEDSEANSFAGQHETILNVRPDEIPQAILKVRESLRSDRVVAYRRKRGITGEPRMGVVIQKMVERVSKSAVVFTKNPIDDTDGLVVEYTDGLGDRLVGGKVTPVTLEIERGALNKQPGWIAKVGYVALACERIIQGPADVEAAYNGDWWVCQARRVTT